ncbi:unnamed protein product [Oikopleura dioica]|uniref:RING-type domain-containing protein n=2 Tax=Oikopleura dioica TaxID=34765 RepID=E4YQM8_OIKDI|nr:unnamed protein product [Oikopleura dioica]
MGFDAEIDNSERNSVVENLKDEVQCSICCSIFEDPMKLDCCDGHLCKKCYESVKEQFQNCPLCRKLDFTAKFSRLMVTVLSQYKLFCPAVECNESVPYANFGEHKESCPALNKKPCPQCKKLYWKNDFLEHFSCFDELNKTAQLKEKEVTELEWKITELELKIKPITQSRDAHAKNNKNLKILNQNYAQRIHELQEALANEKDQIQNQQIVIKKFEDKTRHLEQDLATDKQKVQNQKIALSGLHKKVEEQKIVEQQLEQKIVYNDELKKKQVEALNHKIQTNQMKITDLESKKTYLEQGKQALTYNLQKEFKQRMEIEKKLNETKQQSLVNLGKAEMSAMTISRLRSKIDKMQIETKTERDLNEELNSAYQQISYLNKKVNDKRVGKNSGFFGLFKK